MKPISIQQIKSAVGGRALAPLPADAPLVTSISSDSRKMDSGSLFIALRGERYDGHKFLAEVASKGAIAAMVGEIPNVELPNMHFLQVDDTRRAMGRLATFCRKRLRGKVIAVAGSNGKTSTKKLIHAALLERFQGSFSPKSFNNDIGVPLAIFPANPTQDYLVLEMGTNHPGEIKVLTEMALPDIGVITNCGAEHLEFLGDLMGVRQENASLLLGLNPKGTLIVNGDDPQLLDAVAGFPGQRITFGYNDSNDLFATDIRCSDHGTHFKLNGRRQYYVPLLGRHNACNALAAIAVARRMGVQEDLIAMSLAVAQGPEMRLERHDLRTITLLNDAYNANPNSMRAGLETLRDLNSEGRRVAILGDMRELGPSSDRYHRELGAAAAECKLDLLICVGRDRNLIAEGAVAAGIPKSRVRSYETAEQAVEKAPGLIRDGDMVLLKASRAVRLERVSEAIRQRFDRIARRKAS